MGIKIGESYDSFRKLRESGSYYIDKTWVLKHYLQDNFKSAVLFARPRRFGKTLTMTMFRDFLDVRQDSKGIFQGLQVMGDTAFTDAYMNRWPVVFISMKEIFGNSYESLFDAFRLLASNTCKSMRYLLESAKVNDSDKTLFLELEHVKSQDALAAAAEEASSQIVKNKYESRLYNVHSTKKTVDFSTVFLLTFVIRDYSAR